MDASLGGLKSRLPLRASCDFPIMSPGTKGALVALVERRADSCHRDEAEASNLSSMVITWAMSSITFLIGIFIATPSTLDQTWRYLSGLVLFFSTFLGFRRLDARVSKPHAALARWMAARYDTLLELYLLDSIGDKEFRECADSIRLSHARWLDMKWWAQAETHWRPPYCEKAGRILPANWGNPSKTVTDGLGRVRMAWGREGSHPLSPKV